MSKTQASVLFLGKKRDRASQKAAEFCQQHFGEASICLGKPGDSLPEGAAYWDGDFILSLSSPWLVPGYLIQRARSAINIHPGPPEYPGIGSPNFALYDGAQTYGVTAHHLAQSVCSGPIIAVKEFPLLASDSLPSLLERTGDYQTVLFYDVAGSLAGGSSLPASEREWSGPPTTLEELDTLARIDSSMSHQEIVRRARATTTAERSATVEIDGWIFELRGQHEARLPHENELLVGGRNGNP